ncbi:HEAT repeat domain-containing protein, partial [uncultured Acinetobacter sp.]|uniref:HEAT repeat domain-containing protein n=1 Tax=uncultured Acinetobacter sp. TaxID=165433 RepID=UPI00261DA4A0
DDRLHEAANILFKLKGVNEFTENQIKKIATVSEYDSYYKDIKTPYYEIRIYRSRYYKNLVKLDERTKFIKDESLLFSNDRFEYKINWECNLELAMEMVKYNYIRLRTDAIKVLLKKINTRDIFMKGALYTLRYVNASDSNAIDVLISLLKDTDQVHRELAAEALGIIGLASRSVIEALINYYKTHTSPCCYLALKKLISKMDIAV